MVAWFGRSDNKRHYLSSSSIEVRPFLNRPCDLNTNAAVRYSFAIEHLIILNVSSLCGFLNPTQKLPLRLF